MPLHICHLTSIHQPVDVRIFHKECSSLAKAGYKVSLIHPGELNEVRNGVTIIGLSIKAKSRLQRMTKTVNAVFKKAAESNADIYHLHDPELMRIGVKLLKQGKKVIYDAHEDLPRQISGKDWIPSLIRDAVSSIAEKSENNFARKATAVVAATPFIASRFKKINAKTIDINNYPILEEFEKSSVLKPGNEICYIGGISRIRGIYELIGALEKINVTLNLAGTFEDAITENELKQLDGWSKVKFHGYVGRKEVNEILSRSSIGMVTLYPQINYLDSLPIKMFEYMAAGIPVIASDFPYWKTIVESNQCGVTVNPKNSTEIAATIQQLIGNSSLMKQLGENGRKAVEEKFNWKMEEKKLIQLYESL